MKSLYIYNIFPKLYNNSKEWEKNLNKIISMGFNSVYLNPLHYPGFSGSIYSPKEFYEYNPQFFSDKKPHEAQLKEFLDKAKENNIDVFMDLVVNHTAIDCELTKDHREWYELSDDGEVKHPGTWQNGSWEEWGDLAKLNLESSSDRDGLWNYFLEVCNHYLELGFSGFRCDAAYQVSPDFWNFLIENVKKKYSSTLFLAETLGCTPVQVQTLSNCGFDYIFNSSKWWNFHDTWCLEQYALTMDVVPSISFPESHDTPRLMEEVRGDKNAFLQRLYFEAVYSTGFMITTGFEYGFRKQISTVETTPHDWEDTEHDFTKQIKKILEIKNAIIPLQKESPITIIEQANWQNVFCFVKESDGIRVLIILNKDVQSTQHISLSDVLQIIKKEKVKDYSPGTRIKGIIKSLDIDLQPGEIKIFASELDYIKPPPKKIK